MMTRAIRTLLQLVLAVATLGAATDLLFAQAGSRPNNDLPNPYEAIDGWARMPIGRQWGATSAIGLDPDGKSIWVAERCGVSVNPNSPPPKLPTRMPSGLNLRTTGTATSG